MNKVVELLRSEGLDHFHSFKQGGRTVEISLALRKPNFDIPAVYGARVEGEDASAWKQRVHSESVARELAQHLQGSSLDVSLEPLKPENFRPFEAPGEPFSHGGFKGPARIVLTAEFPGSEEALATLEKRLEEAKILRVRDLKEGASRAQRILK